MRAAGGRDGMSPPVDFEAVDRQIADLTEKLQGCRRAMAVSRAAAFGAGAVLLLVLTLAGSYRTPTIVFGAVSVIIGGTVWLGASRTSQAELQDRLSALDGVKSRMIDEIAAQNGWHTPPPGLH
jgi:hypothetical protein